MRKILSLVAIMVFAIQSQAMIYKCDNFDSSKKTCRLIGWSGSQPTSTKLKLPSSYKGPDSITYTIKTVGEHALDNLTEVTEITIPASYTKIGLVDDAYTYSGCLKNFNNCPKLKLYKVESGSKLLEASDDGLLFLKGGIILLQVPENYACNNGKFYIPNKCKYIMQDAFAGNSTIHTLSIPKDVDIYFNGGFNRMTKLSKIELTAASSNNLALHYGVLSQGNRIISLPPGKNTFTFTVPEDITEISPYAFYNTENLSTIYLHPGIKRIGDFAFSNSIIEEICITGNLEKCGNDIFSNCQALKSISFKGRDPKVTDRFAINCPNLRSVKSDNPIVFVGESAFKNCRGLKEFPFRGETVLSEDSSFYNTGLERVVFEDSAMADYFSGVALFGYCRDLTEIDFSRLNMEGYNGDLSIGNSYAANCMKLKKVVFGAHSNFWRYNPEYLPTEPAFGYSCVIDTICISTTPGSPSPQFIYSSFNGKRHFTPRVYATTTVNYGYSKIYNTLNIGQLFYAGNGATVAPLIYCDAFELEKPSWPENLSYVVPDATYFIPGGTRANYHLAIEEGNKVIEMFDILFKGDRNNSLTIQITPRTDVEELNPPYDFSAEFENGQTVYADQTGTIISPLSLNDISKIRLHYKVDGYYYLTDYPKEYFFNTPTGIEATAIENRVKVKGKIIEFGEKSSFEIFSTDGSLVMSGCDTRADLNSLSKGIFLVRYQDSSNNFKTIKIYI